MKQEPFAAEVDEVTATFTVALRESVAPELTEHTQLTTADVEEIWDWDALAETLAEAFTEEPVWMVDEEEAIARLTDAIVAEPGVTLDSPLIARRAIEAAVADAYQTTIRQFIDRAASTAAADAFLMETNTELTTAVDELDERLRALQRELRWDTAALRIRASSGLISYISSARSPVILRPPGGWDLPSRMLRRVIPCPGSGRRRGPTREPIGYSNADSASSWHVLDSLENTTPCERDVAAMQGPASPAELRSARQKSSVFVSHQSY